MSEAARQLPTPDAVPSRRDWQSMSRAEREATLDRLFAIERQVRDDQLALAMLQEIALLLIDEKRKDD